MQRDRHDEPLNFWLPFTLPHWKHETHSHPNLLPLHDKYFLIHNTSLLQQKRSHFYIHSIHFNIVNKEIMTFTQARV